MTLHDTDPHIQDPLQNVDLHLDPSSIPVITRYDKEKFYSRFDLLVQLSGRYEGTLDATFDTIESIDPVEVARPDMTALTVDQEQQYDMAVNRLKHAGVGSVIMEAAHVYAYQDLADEELKDSLLAQCFHAAALTEKLAQKGIEVHQMLFIDDYNLNPSGNNQQKLDVNHLLELVRSVGYNPTQIAREKDMVSLAQAIMGYMGHKQDLLKLETTDDSQEQSDTERVMLTRRNIELFRATDATVSCAMLDAALTVVKLQYFGGAVVNILPRRSPNGEFSYNGQQRKMRTIIQEHLNLRVSPIINLFTGESQADAIAAGSHHALRKPH